MHAHVMDCGITELEEVDSYLESEYVHAYIHTCNGLLHHWIKRSWPSLASVVLGPHSRSRSMAPASWDTPHPGVSVHCTHIRFWV